MIYYISYIIYYILYIILYGVAQKKNGTAYFPHYVETLTSISV